MEDIKFRCDNCGLKIETSIDQAGTNIVCPSCRESIEIPESPALPAAQDASIPPRTIPMTGAWEPSNDEKNPAPDSANSASSDPDHEQHTPATASSPSYKVVPLSLSPEEEKTPASVARKVERTIQAFSVGGWRFLRIDAITYETKGALGSNEEIVHLATFIQE